jgi:hypothetical protein
MNNKLGFSLKFSLLFALVFLIEVLIAVFLDDAFIRPFVGDVLVVILLYFFVRTLTKFEHLQVVIGVLLFSYLVELGQYFNLIAFLNLQDIKLARLVIGTTYDKMDLVAYSLGALILYFPIKISNKLLFIGIITLIVGTLIPLINFIPTWEIVEIIAIVLLFFITAIIWLIFLINIWINNIKNRSSLKFIDWFESIILSITMIGLVAILFLISVLLSGHGIFGPTLKKTIEISDVKIFLYENSCFPPDNECECGNYYSLIYIKNYYLPIMDLKKKVNFYVEDIQINKSKLVIIPSEKCGIVKTIPDKLEIA